MFIKYKSPLSSPLRVWQSESRLRGLENVEYGMSNAYVPTGASEFEVKSW